MLDRISDYCCVDMSRHAAYISGDIMPRRDIIGGEHALKYEDLAFLREAKLERAMWRIGPPATLQAPLIRKIDASIFAANEISANITAQGESANPYTSDGGDFINRNCVLPTSSSGGSGTVVRASTIPAGIQDFALTLETVGPSARSRLESDEVRKAYLNVMAMRRTIVKLRLADLLTYVRSKSVYATIDGRTSTPTYYETDFTTSAATSVVLYDISYVGFLGTAWTMADVVRYTGGVLRYFPWAVAAWLVLRYAVSVGSGPAVGAVTKHQLAVSATPGSVGQISGSFDVMQDCFNVASVAGISWQSSPSYDPGVAGGSVSLAEAALIVDLDFPAEIDSLGWSWSPA